jgi:DNA-binding response OmpR family regulator
MAGEDILVIDDSVVVLKLTAAALRQDGYRVHLASTAEQALLVLPTMTPALILVDIQLPGMNGLEFTRRVKESPRTKDVPVVALTGLDARETEQLAYHAGCDGFISKPVDTVALGSRIRAFLLKPASPAPFAEFSASLPAPPAAAEFAFTGPEVNGLRRKFLTESHREVRRILEFLNVRLDSDAAARQFHQWIGSAGALGYPAIAERSRAAAAVLKKPGWTTTELRLQLEALLQALASPPEASDTPIPAAILEQVNGKRVALVGFADEEADKLCEALERAHALARLFAAGEPIASVTLNHCNVAIVHVRPQTLDSPWLLPSGELPPGLPLMLLGSREHILELPDAVQSRACEWLIDAWQPEEAVMRLSFALSRAQAAHPPAPDPAGHRGILIADDDPNVLAVVSTALHSFGFPSQTATDGIETLRTIRETRPRAVVLDVGMPGMDGFDILSAIRREALPIKVVLLTALRQEADILRGFRLGADDYVVKPFQPAELAARIRRLI